MVQERSGDVSGSETFFEQAFDEMFLLLEFAALERGADLGEKYVRPRFFNLACSRRFAALDARVGIAFNVADLENFPTSGE